MKIYPPHGSIHDQTEFWYDPNEKALLYEVAVQAKPGTAIAEHEDRHVHRDPVTGMLCHHYHYEPHGISFKDVSLQTTTRKANIANIDLIVRLWHQIVENRQLKRTRIKEPLIPVPKTLALFLAAKRTDMHREASLTQAIGLLQSYVASRECSLPPSS